MRIIIKFKASHVGLIWPHFLLRRESDCLSACANSTLAGQTSLKFALNFRLL